MDGNTVLIVDDVTENLAVIAEYLKNHGIQIAVAEDGYEGLRRAELLQPDLILLDVMMPGIDGFETCRRLKANPLTQDIPVIFMSALTDIPNKVTGFEAGGIDYITKPFQIEEVHARIKAQLAMRAMQSQLRTINRQLEEAHNQLLQSEKMASIGQLAAGVAHEINNPIGFVSSNLSMLENYIRSLMSILNIYETCEPALQDEPAMLQRIAAGKDDIDLEYLKTDIFSLLDESKDGLGRVKKIVQDLKEFSHVNEPGWKRINLHQGFDSTHNIVNNELKFKATVIKEYGELPDIECMPSEINQVFMNMLVNAGHAIANHGTIIIRTGTEGENVWFEISDSGCGIAPEHINRVFDPFFTTKPVGKGTGLGLSLSYSIVKKHRGHIEVSSELGKGTTFRVTLPIDQPHQTAAA